MVVYAKTKRILDNMPKQDVLDFHYDYNVAMCEAFSSVYKRPDDYPRFQNRDKYPHHIAAWNEIDSYVKEKGWLDERTCI